MNDLRNCDDTIEALAGDDDVLAEVQDAVLEGMKPGSDPEEALLKVTDAVDGRPEINAGRRALGRDATRFGSPLHPMD